MLGRTMKRAGHGSKDMSYEYDVAYRKGAFQAMLYLRGVVEHFQNGYHSKVMPKKAYKLLYSYLDEACHNIDEFMRYGGLPNIIIDNENVCRRVSEEEAREFRIKCWRQAQERKKNKNDLS